MVTLITTPISGIAPNLQNLFAGFGSVVFGFERQDTTVSSVTQYDSTRIKVSVPIDLTSYLAAGMFVYLYAECDTYTYNASFEVSEVTATDVLLLAAWVQNSYTGGYLNYKQNYYLEGYLQDEISGANISDFTLRAQGTASGAINLDFGVYGDLLTKLNNATGEQTQSRIRAIPFAREVYDTNENEDYTQLSDTIVIAYAAEDSQLENETIANAFDLPRFYLGYPNIVTLLHTHENSIGKKVFAEYDELNVNQVDITTANLLHTFSVKDSGQLLVNISPFTPTANTDFIKLRFDTTAVADFDSVDFDNADFYV